MLPLHINVYAYSPRIFIAASLSVLLLVSAGIFFYEFQARNLLIAHASVAAQLSPVATDGVHAVGGLPTAATATDTKSSPFLEINIANNGLVHLSGARVVSISDNTIEVAMGFNAASFNWVIQTSPNTKYPTTDGSYRTRAAIQIGDIVTVTGMLTKGDAEPTIDA